MRRLRSIIRRVARWLGLHDDGVTEVERRRAAWNAELDGRWLKTLRKKETR